MSRAYIPQALRDRVQEEALRRCGYCLTQEAVVGAPMEVDHLVPEALGGRTEADNLWLACSLCNGHKADRVAALDPATGGVVRLFNPRLQVWGEHFLWTADGDQIAGRTASGRATVLALRLNRPSLMRSRRAWVLAGWHPPADTREPR